MNSTDPEVKPTPTFPYICERDIDLLLVEELRCFPSFQEWFVRKLLPTPPDSSPLQVRATEILHSYSEIGQGAGESDILASFELSSPRPQRFVAFIENKIDANFQPFQPERYAERARAAKEQRNSDCFMTVIIAPRDYLETQDGSNLFDVRIPYEDIIAYFEGSRSNDADGVITRSRHRQEMLEQAVHKRRRGYVPTINADVTSFWICYWELAVRVAPSLRLNRPIPKPARSNFVFFNKALEAPPPLRKCKIKHKLELGRVDLEFAGWAERLKRDRPILESFADTDMTLKQRSKSMAFSIEVPKLDTNAAFEPQSELAAFGLQAALRMQKWFQTNCDRLQKYAER